MLSEIVQNDLDTMVQKLMKKEGIEKYKIHVEGQTCPGDNYLADVFFVKVTTDIYGKVYNLVMKTAKRSEEVRELFGVPPMYDRELFAYSVIFPTFQKFVEEEANDDFRIDFLPKLFFIENEKMHETLLLQNMSAKGYKMWDRKKPWNLEHSLFVMKTYGKFHALSLALNNKKPIEFEEMTKDLCNVGTEFGEKNEMLQYYQDIWNDIVDVLKKAGKYEWIEKLDDVGKDVVNIVTGTAAEEDRLVVCHADCWNNNFMFKYQNENDVSPSEICMLDFQLLLRDTPVKDLSYNIYTTCAKSSLDQFDLLINTYYRSMSDTLKTLGCDPDNIFTFEDLQGHLKKYARYGLVVSSVVLKIALAEKSEALQLETVSKSDKGLTEALKYNISNEEEFNRRILDAVEHYIHRFI